MATTANTGAATPQAAANTAAARDASHGIASMPVNSDHQKISYILQLMRNIALAAKNQQQQPKKTHPRVDASRPTTTTTTDVEGPTIDDRQDRPDTGVEAVASGSAARGMRALRERSQKATPPSTDAARTPPPSHPQQQQPPSGTPSALQSSSDHHTTPDVPGDSSSAHLKPFRVPSNLVPYQSGTPPCRPTAASDQPPRSPLQFAAMKRASSSGVPRSPLVHQRRNAARRNSLAASVESFASHSSLSGSRVSSVAVPPEDTPSAGLNRSGSRHDSDEQRTRHPNDDSKTDDRGVLVAGMGMPMLPERRRNDVSSVGDEAAEAGNKATTTTPKRDDTARDDDDDDDHDGDDLPSEIDADEVDADAHEEGLHGRQPSQPLGFAASAATELDPTTGDFTTINGIDLYNEVGRGAYGRVIHAVCDRYDFELAVKEVPRRLVAPTQELTEVALPDGSLATVKLAAEVRVMAQLQHPNIVPMLEVIDDPALPSVYMVMPFVRGKQSGTTSSVSGAASPATMTTAPTAGADGPPLPMNADVLAAAAAAATASASPTTKVFTCTTLPVDELRFVALDVASALLYCAKNKVVHGDIKPENIMVEPVQSATPAVGAALPPPIPDQLTAGTSPDASVVDDDSDAEDGDVAAAETTPLRSSGRRRANSGSSRGSSLTATPAGATPRTGFSRLRTVRAKVTDFGVAVTLQGGDWRFPDMPSPQARPADRPPVSPSRFSLNSISPGLSGVSPGAVPLSQGRHPLGMSSTGTTGSQFDATADGNNGTPNTATDLSNVSFMTVSAFLGDSTNPFLNGSLNNRPSGGSFGGLTPPLSHTGLAPPTFTPLASAEPVHDTAATAAASPEEAGLRGQHSGPFGDSRAATATPGARHLDGGDDKDESLLQTDASPTGTLHAHGAKKRALGTPAFLAPELVTGTVTHPTPASDAWAFGVTLFGLKYGRLPFSGASLVELHHSIVHDRPPFPPVPARDRDGRRWRALIAALLSREPSTRLTMREAVNATVLHVSV